MPNLIDIESYPVRNLLPVLLADKTTKQNIIWATDTYADRGTGYQDRDHINLENIIGLDPIDLQPRISKTVDEQLARTRKKAEVFTPVWLCNQMNNYCDEEWFGRKNVFNIENEDHTWTVTEEKVWFPNNKKLTWQKYVDSRRLEITCGEAPFLVSRYDAATGELIVPPIRRIGILDRKLRIVNENAANDNEWFKWTKRAFQSCYGFEYQGDSLLIARINILMTYVDYHQERFHKMPDLKLLKSIANIIAWNIWQMDGLQDTVPLGKPKEENHQLSLFEMEGFADVSGSQELESPLCIIKDWRDNSSCTYKSLKERG